MLPLSKEQLQQVRDTGWLREVVFKTEPRVNKMEIAALLRSMYNIEADSINTINYEGKKKRIFDPKGRPKWYRQTDWKKVYVTVKPPKQAAKAADAAQRNAVAAFERERLKSVESGVGRQRYELLPLAVRHALMERRDAARGEQGAARGEQGTAAAAGRGERGRGERGAAAARGGPAGKRQRGRRLGFVQRQDGQGVPETRDT
ncbi:ribosomal protein L23 [Monoraphidium neglectum]|uniref:Large ribosomal subunit protein uL23c n=1 Tax=Monoraphidium neglectum TaxID=145388 RepID=A0A0D2MVP4_9CHLO|nr:ribosomal protein L23 [Monoraphidium neglectum]KIZ04567.1 ribosomal protein L23 [Monoraphidium neglectum]|eukprot:XP_013903586.1 ribosomal protein L23 [Monoraphidium neglectum]